LSIFNRFVPLVYDIDLVLSEQKELVAAGPPLTICHRFQPPYTTGCTPGEEIYFISLDAAGGITIKLSTATKIIIDYLARNRVPQNASQIEAGIRADPFYRKHGHNGTTSKIQTRKICRSLVRVYVERFRKALGTAFADAGIALDPRSVLISEPTDGNEVLYRLKASIRWRHISLGPLDVYGSDPR
jgi:hypothetical protein